MSAYPNRSAERKIQQHSLDGETKPETTSRVGTQTSAAASDQCANVVEPITMRVPEACRYIGISRSTLYILIANGEIETIKLGCSTLVLTESLKALIEKRRGLSETPSAQVRS